MQLLQRQKQIPNGIFYYEPRTKWRSRPGSFDNVVEQMIAHRQGNAWLGLSTDRGQVANELDQFAASWCAQNGWGEYISGGNPANPLPPPPSLASRLANVAAGAETLVEWIGSGAEAVPAELSNKRGAICSDCPQNERGDLMRFFTLPVAEAIRKALSARCDMKLSTPDDFRLGVCAACSCSLRLKIHLPLDRIKPKMKPEVLGRLDPRCWILRDDK